VAVFNHPWFAATDEKGAFTIKDVPAGKYRLMVWHEAHGWQDPAGKEITVKDGTVEETVTWKEPETK
jgi:hypothetical protein